MKIWVTSIHSTSKNRSWEYSAHATIDAAKDWAYGRERITSWVEEQNETGDVVRVESTGDKAGVAVIVRADVPREDRFLHNLTAQP